ncbi:MAG: hypothetical protein OEM61_12770, partial [Desulfobacteraceae bacterium]|nr:hypothetical protein [Desulfobacteraceae bacterium]
LCKSVHHLADISQTSTSFRIFLSAITFPGLLFKCNFVYDHRAAVIQIIFFNVFFRISKAIANKVVVFEFISFLGV